MKFVSKNFQCPKNIHIRAVAAQMKIIFQLNIFLRIVSIIQTGHNNLHFYSFMALYKNVILGRYLQLCSSSKYYPNVNNTPQKLLLNKSYADSSSIHRYLFKNVNIFYCNDHLIWVENPRKGVYLFTGHPVYI